MVAKDTSTLVGRFLNGVLQGTCEMARTAVHSVVYKVVEQFLLDILRRKVMDKSLKKHNTHSC